uniref:Uncharacterized protein n=1 Tax=Zonotrichia albicollis TaxID=44394 RepID=A0A8D2MQS2_ZONAL
MSPCHSTECHQVCPPAKCHQVCPPAIWDNWCPPAMCHQVCPPTMCHQVCPSAIWDNCCPPAVCHQVCPPAKCHQMRPSAKCHQVCPPAVRWSEDLQPRQEILLGPQVALVTPRAWDEDNPRECGHNSHFFLSPDSRRVPKEQFSKTSLVKFLFFG